MPHDLLTDEQFQRVIIRLRQVASSDSQRQTVRRIEERLDRVAREAREAGISMTVTRHEEPPPVTDTPPTEPGFYWAYLPLWGEVAAGWVPVEVAYLFGGCGQVALWASRRQGCYTMTYARRWGPPIEPFRPLDNETGGTP